MLNHLVGLKIKKNYDEEYYNVIIIAAQSYIKIKD